MSIPPSVKERLAKLESDNMLLLRRAVVAESSITELEERVKHWRTLYDNLLREHDSWARIASDLRVELEECGSRLSEQWTSTDDDVMEYMVREKEALARIAELEVALAQARCGDCDQRPGHDGSCTWTAEEIAEAEREADQIRAELGLDTPSVCVGEDGT